MGQLEDFCKRLQKIREEIEQVNQEIQKAQHSYNLERAAELQYGKLPQLTKQLEEEEKKVKERDFLVLVHESVTDEEIARIISRWTGIPVAKLNESERARRFILTKNSTNVSLGRMRGYKSNRGDYPFESRYQRSYETNRLIPVPRPPGVGRQSLQKHSRRVCLMMRAIWFVLI